MARAVCIDGRLVDANGASVSVFDRGFLYGDSVFETLRTYRGVAFALDAHLERLAASAALVQIPLPVSLDVLRQEVQQALTAAGSGEHWLRFMLTRGEGPLGLDPGVPLVARRVVLVCPLHVLADEVYEHGVAGITFQGQREVDIAGVPSVKYGNYLLSVLATRAARARQAHEALIVSPDGHIAEGASSNLFFVKQGVLHTPPLSAGILAGITRQHLLELAQQLNLPLEYSLPRLEDLLSAEEVAISSSIREFVPVVSLDGRPIANGVPGPVTRRLLQEFRTVVWR